MSSLTDFYLGKATDAEGRLLEEIWRWRDDELEMTHDFIQWLFPLPERSGYNSRAPLLTDEDIAAFKQNELLSAHLLRSFQQILGFLGLRLTEDGKVVKAENFADRAPDVWDEPNHNWLRISRILRSLVLLGLGNYAKAFYERLNEFYRSNQYPIPPDTFQYWTAAAGGRRWRD